MNDTKPGSGWLPEQILNAFSDPVCMIDSSGLIIAANTHFISIFSPDYDGDPKKTIYNDEAINSCQNALRKCINTILNGSKMGLTGGDFQCTVDKNNFTELFTFSVSPIHSEQNPPTFMIRAYQTSGSEEEKTPKYRENFFTYVFEILTRLSTTQEVDNEILIFLSKLGRIMGSDYVSFFESDPESIKQDIIPEVIIWSQRDGLSMTSSGKDPESGEFFIRTKPVPDPNIPAFFTLDQVPEYFHAMMIKRKVYSVRIFPAIAQSTFTGSFVFWNKNLDIWTDEEITMIQSLVSIIGHNLYWFKIGNELTRSEEMFQGVLEYIGDMYFLTDKTGDLLVISPSMASSLEYDTLDELKGKNFQSLLKYPEIWPGFLSEIIQENSLRDYQMILRGKNGKIVVGSVSCRLTYDQNEGSLIGIEGVIRDITRRKQYEQMMNETEWRLKQAQKIARLGVWSYSMSTRAFRVSPEVFSILALPISKGEVCLEEYHHDNINRRSPAIGSSFFCLYPGRERV